MSTSVSPASSTSGEASSSVSATAKSVRPPRNSHRLSNRPEPTPTPSATLGPAINFKVPSLPRQRTTSSIDSSTSDTSTCSGRRPLKMVEDGNGPLSPREDGTSTPNRLKRLSLIARPSPLIESPNVNQEDRDKDRPMSARLSGDVNRTPRSMRMRSSISYSPASTSIRPTARSAVMSPDAGGPRDESASGGRGSMDGAAKGETWSDRHADLLQSIAQKQRRINELKQADAAELQAEQSALYSLKSHFASLVSNTFSSPPPTNGQTSTLPIHRSTSNTTDTDWSLVSSAPSSHTSPDLNRNREERERESEPNPPGFSSLLDDVLGNAPLVDPSVVEGGRRFIGNLMRTVGAAAGGSVPVEKTEAQGEAEESRGDRHGNKDGHSIGGMDISSIKGMFSSWSSASTTPRPNTVRIRPADPVARNIGSTPSPQSETPGL